MYRVVDGSVSSVVALPIVHCTIFRFGGGNVTLRCSVRVVPLRPSFETWVASRMLSAIFQLPNYRLPTTDNRQPTTKINNSRLWSEQSLGGPWAWMMAPLPPSDALPYVSPEYIVIADEIWFPETLIYGKSIISNKIRDCHRNRSSSSIFEH